MLKATLREYMGSEERAKQALVLDVHAGSITIGRSESCRHTIGKTLGELAKYISSVQATITFDGDRVTLKDGDAKPSANGIYCHSDKIDGSIALVPGLELTIFRYPPAKVTLSISQEDPEYSGGDTYTGKDLLFVLEEQVALLQQEIKEVKEVLAESKRLDGQVAMMAIQLERREAIDDHQEAVIAEMSKTTKRIMSSLLGLTAAIVLGSGWAKDISADDRKQWMSALLSFALAGSAVYVQKKTKESTTGQP